MEDNHSILPKGNVLSNWQKAKSISATLIEGQYCRLEKLNAELHAEGLYHAFSHDHSHQNWTYLPYGPFLTLEGFQQWLYQQTQIPDPYFFVVSVNGQINGMLSLMRIQEEMGSIEVGHIHFSPLLQRTTASTEAIYLLMEHAFNQGYRRLEWKCDSLNQASCSTAKRLGFTFEGTFRQAGVYKGRNRDTSWFSIIDSEWTALHQAYQYWLSDDNQPNTKQRHSLQFFINGENQ